MDSEKTTLKPGLYLSVDETQRLITQARRIRSEHLRASMRQFVSWIVRRWSGNPVRDEPSVPGVSPAAESAPNSQAQPPADRLRRAA